MQEVDHLEGGTGVCKNQKKWIRKKEERNCAQNR